MAKNPPAPQKKKEGKKSKKGEHSKKSSNLKTSKNYEKTYKGQGR